MTWTIEIERIAGILTGQATIEPGLNAVRASNWQGKSSFIKAIETALGVATPLTEGRESGQVRLETPERTVVVELERADGDGTVVRSGTPYHDDEYDAVRTELFACLDERNAVRRAVRNGENLESVLLEPLDFQNIDERIADLERERERVDSKLAQAREAANRLPAAQEKVTRLEDELATLRERYEELSGRDDGSSADRSELSQARSDYQQAENRIERLERSIDRAEDRLAEKRTELEDVDVEDSTDYADQLETAREELRVAKRDKEVLQSVYSATELVLEEDRLDLVADVERELTGDTVTCWTCGTDASRAAVEDRLDELGERIATTRVRVGTARETVEQLEAKRERREQARRRRDDLETEIAELEETLADHRASLETVRERRDEAQARVEELSESVDETVEAVTDVESEIKYREAELDDATAELAQLEERAQKREDLEDERDSIDEEITELRNRKDRITFEARQAFETAMQDILARFDTGFETARLTGNFDLVVARDGREARLDALSEGELELLGFVAALAGYESFDVAETVPIMLVDSVGALADENLHTLISYLEPRADYLVFTVYPEHAAFDGAEIDPSEWQMATDSVRAGE